MTSTTWGRGWSLARLGMAVVIAAAVIAQLMKSLQSASELDRSVATVAVNFFSFFTIQSNTLTVIVLLVAAVAVFIGRDGGPRWLEVALAAVSTYMVVTGIVYNALLRGIELPQGSEAIGWSNEVLHLIGPVFMAVDVVVAPIRRRLPWSALGAIVLVPIVWVAYTLVRGPLVQNPVTGASYWYPYPFLDPNGAGGWSSVVAYIVGIAVVILAVGAVVVLVKRFRLPDKSAPEAPDLSLL